MSSNHPPVDIKKKSRRRLVGAALLLLTAAVFLPMIFAKAPPESMAAPQIRVPAPPIPYQPEILLGKDQENAHANPSAESAPPPTPPQDIPNATVAPDQIPTPSAANVTTEKPDAATAPLRKNSPAAQRNDNKTHNPTAELWALQFGIFSDKDNAEKIIKRLKAQNVTAKIESVKDNKGQKFRVKSGPYASREDAEKTLERLRKANVQGLVLPPA